MDEQLIGTLANLNEAFYRRTACSFSSTRRNSWPGWERVAALFADALAEEGRREAHVLDLAAGNLRFESFLESRLPGCALRFTAADSCTDFPLLEVASPCTPVRVDLVRALRDGRPTFGIACGPADLAVSFGFAHHIPGGSLRAEFVRQTVAALAPGGIAAIAFWNFLQDGQMAQRAAQTTEQARARLDLPPLEEGDFILGWQNDPDALRYCHSFCEAEIDALVQEVSHDAQLLDRFESDGRTGNLNSYLVLRRR